jgi:ATP-dependent helicase/nuclease subunit A
LNKGSILSKTRSSPVQYTPQQQAAIGTRGVSIGLSAGAGCGKTFVLTQRFLSHLEPGPDAAELWQLVAITFTDRAAREMRDRIRRTALDRMLTCPPEHALHWQAVLRDLDAARISTFHSFCTGLLRTHAIAAGLDPQFSVLEPAVATTLIERSTQQVLQERLIADDPDMTELAVQYGLQTLSELLHHFVRDRFRLDWPQFMAMSPESLARLWDRQWLETTWPECLQQWLAGPSIRRLLQVLHEHTPQHPEMQRRCAELQVRLTIDDPRWSQPTEQLAAIQAAAFVKGGGGKEVWPDEATYEFVQDALKSLREDCKQWLAEWQTDPQRTLRAATIGCQVVRMAALVVARYEAVKAQRGTLDFDDLLLRTRDLLRDSEEVCQRVASGIRLLMVDEVQDTDPIQAELITYLCGDRLASGQLFFVGDFKQSIYRFRRADPEVFHRLRAMLPAAGRLTLSENFRSQPEILRFVNVLFRPVFPDAYEPLVPHDRQQWSPGPTVEFLWATEPAGGSAGCVPGGAMGGSAEGAPGSTSGSEELSGSASISETGESSDAYENRKAAIARRDEADAIARRIAVLLNDPTPRVRDHQKGSAETRLRRVQPGDIVILFRALSDVAVYENALRQYEIDYYLVKGKAFYAQQEIYDLLNLCSFLVDPDDAVALLGVLRSPMGTFSDDLIQQVCPVDGDWSTVVDQMCNAQIEWPQLSDDDQRRVQQIGRVLQSLLFWKDRLPIAELVQRAIALTGYDAALLAEHLGSRKVANLQKLIEQARVYDDAPGLTLRDFVRRLQADVFDQTDEEFATTLPETGQTVRLMTIHQSKGLEFPVVFVADIDRRAQDALPQAVLHGQWGPILKLPAEPGRTPDHRGRTILRHQERRAQSEESLRLLYVAVTRAADHLILSAGRQPDTRPKSGWLTVLSERFHLDTGLLRDDPWLGSMAGLTDPKEIPSIRVTSAAMTAATSPVASPKAVPLSRLIEDILTAEPETLPASAEVFPAVTTDQDVWSVSQLEDHADRRGWLTASPVAGSFTPAAMSTTTATSEPISGRTGADKKQTMPIEPEGSPLIGLRTGDATLLGMLVHAALEQVDPREAAVTASMVARIARVQQWAASDAVTNAAAELVSRLMSSSTMVPWREALRTEREVDFWLNWPSPATLITGQIDLLFRDAAGWHIWDFKTGQVRPETHDDAVWAAFDLQLGLYALAVEQWFGEPPVSVSLICLQPRVRQIRRRWTDDDRRRVTALVARCLLELRTTSTTPAR